MHIVSKFQFFIHIFTVEKLENKMPTFEKWVKIGVFLQPFQSNVYQLPLLDALLWYEEWDVMTDDVFRCSLMFFTVFGYNSPRIEGAAMDGSHRRVVVSEKIVYPVGLTLDLATRTIYWIGNSWLLEHNLRNHSIN